MTITKADIVDHLWDSMGLNKRESKDIVESFFDGIRQSLAAGEEVLISGFGKFSVRDKPARPGRNPKTGEPIPITPRRVVTFHASPLVKELCNPNVPAKRRQKA
ncbi:integration host factor subunit alpha [Acidithiobacillus sp. IBUN Pt1247-S3]|uniref:integration host factor subunit alpha n=1 Tax=Acidithiobacillus sp. IBUN Pt1247-S3 TaxID=3166642 RepID=UPI0034E5E282